MDVDSRGIRRGPCTECRCVGYSGGADKMKCIDCGHVPGKHRNLSSVPSGSQASSTLASTSHTYAQAAIPPTSGQYGGYQSPSYQSGGSYPSHGHYSHYPQPSSTRPQCGADWCTNPVHWEPDVGNFDYCSPECRNKHLLPIQKARLHSDLKEMTDWLHTSVPKSTDVSKHTFTG